MGDEDAEKRRFLAEPGKGNAALGESLGPKHKA